MSYYPPTTHSCICPSCLQNLYFQNGISNTKCEKCNLIVYYGSFGCDIVFKEYTIHIFDNSVFIYHKRNEIINFLLEEDFNFNNIDKYYKTSLKYIENMIFL